MSHKLIHQLILLSTFVPFFRLGQCNSYSDGYSMERTSWIPLQGTSANKALLLELQIGNKMRSLKGIAGTECVCAGVGSQGLQFNGTTVPFITNVGPSVIEVPCSYAASNIVGANLQFTGSGTGSFYVKYNVVASPSGDFNKGYVYPTSNGQILRGSIGPTTDTTQTISFSIALEPTWTFSKPVNLTFIYRSCAFQIDGPASFTYCPNQFSGTPFSGLSYTIANLPANTSVIWDAPPPNGAGATLVAQTSSGFVSVPQNSPAVLDSNFISTPTLGPDMTVYISSYTLDPSTNLGVGTYGPSTTSASAPPGECQSLLLSATPQYQERTLFTTGTKKITACASVDPSCNNSAVSFP